MPYVMKPVNKGEITKLRAGDLTTALKEAETLIKETPSRDIIGVWSVHNSVLQRMTAVWVPGSGGWTNM